MEVFVYSKSEDTIESVSVSGRPSVYTITLQRFIRLWWNFVHRTVLLISRSREEDENGWSTPSWVIPKNVIIPVSLFHGVSPKKKQVSLNRPKDILSFRASKVVFVVKKSAITIVPSGRYRSYSFSWKSWKFEKNQKNWKICKFCGLDFFPIIWSKMNSKYIFLFFTSSRIRPHVSSYFAVI
jgi:hypothetical protein